MSVPPSFTLQRTLTLPRPSAAVEVVLSALSLQAKNLYNTGLFLLRNVLSAYVFDKVTGCYQRKTKLHRNQQLALDASTAAVEKVNTARLVKNPTDAKLVPQLTAQLESLWPIVLNDTVLDTACRDHVSGHGDSVYKRLPSIFAQQVRKRLKDAFSAYLAALASFYADQARFTGRPRMPGYLNKQQHYVLDYPVAMLNKGGLLPDVSSFYLPCDYAETTALTQEQAAVLKTLSLDRLFQQALVKAGLPDATPVHLRIVPKRNRHKLEVVVTATRAYPQQSYLRQLHEQHAATLAELSAKQQEAWLKRQLAQLPLATMPRVAGLDFGVTNVAALSYSTGHKAEVVSGRLLEKVMAFHYDRIAAWQQATSTDEMKTLQQEKSDCAQRKQPFAKDKRLRLHQLLREQHVHPTYLRLVEERDNALRNAIHQLSCGIIKSCQAKKVDVLIVGKNVGWKNGKTLEDKEERTRFARIAHARTLEYLRYKAQVAGIAVVTVEESYTSKRSFVENEALKKDKVDASPSSLLKRNHRGENRYWFHNVNRQDRWKRVQADVNAAFNMIRKVFKHFCYHDQLTLKFHRGRLTASHGLVFV